MNDHTDSAPMLFNYGSRQVRTVDLNDRRWAVAADICAVLELGNTAMAVSRLDEADVSTADIRSGGQMRKVTVISEDGATDLVLDSRKPEARKFRRFLTHEVWPAVRDHGGYLTPEKVEEVLLNPDTIIRLATDLKAERERADLAAAQIARERPLVERAKTHAVGTGSKTRQQFFRELKQWAQDAHGITVKQDEVMEFLSTRKLGLFTRGGRRDSGQATAWAIEKGYARNPEGTAPNGHNYVTPEMTPGGQEYAWDRCVRHIDANGTLALPRQIGGAA